MKVVKITEDNTTMKTLNQNRMETAVEWLVEHILQKVQNYEDGDVETEKDPFVIEYVNKYNFNVDLTKYVEQAKEMEKEQIGKAFLNGRIKEIGQGVLFDLQPLTETFNDYYNEAFKSE